MSFSAIPCYTSQAIPGKSYSWESSSKLSHTIPSYSRLFLAIPCNISYAIPGTAIPHNFTLFQAIPWIVLFHAIPYYSLLFHAIHLVPFLERLFLGNLFQADPYYYMLFQGMPCYSMQYILCYSLGSYSTQYHVIPCYNLNSVVPCYSSYSVLYISCYSLKPIPRNVMLFLGIP